MWNKILCWLYEIIEKVLGLLPLSPFTEYIEKLKDMPFLGYLNWFIPIKELLIIGASWLGVIGLFYLYSIVLRWVKA
ncbi:MAG TPA: hypothetical protein H9887_03435, partial [Candidatus Dorea intestinavium]|nr:hypothetical protein [Candidatus Dorea intestinavium]